MSLRKEKEGEGEWVGVEGTKAARESESSNRNEVDRGSSTSVNIFERGTTSWGWVGSASSTPKIVEVKENGQKQARSQRDAKSRGDAS